METSVEESSLITKDKFFAFANHFWGRALLIGLGLFLFVYPVIHADFLFKDDNFRVLMNAPANSWLHDGRLLTVLMMSLLGGLHLTDLAPLPQILWIPFLAPVLSAVSFRFSLNLPAALLALPFVILQPFYLENISYRFEALMMGLSVALAVLPFALPVLMPKLSQKGFWCATVAALLAVSNFYQPSLNLFGEFICFAALLELCQQQKSKKILDLLIFYFSALLASIFIYLVELKILHFFDHGYKGTYSNVHQVMNFTPYALFFNIRDYAELISYGVAKGTQAQFLGLILLFGALSLLWLLGLAFLKAKGREGLYFACLAVFCIMGLFGFLVGPELFLAWPVYQPRILIGFGGFAAILLCFLVQNDSLPLKSIRYALVAVAYSFEILLSFSWGNAAHAQFEQQNRLAAQMLDDMNGLNAFQLKYWATNGAEPLAAQAKRPLMAFPLFGRFLFQDGNTWTNNIEARYWAKKGKKAGWNAVWGEYSVWPIFLQDTLLRQGPLPKNIQMGWEDMPEQEGNRYFKDNGLGKKFRQCKIDHKIFHASFDSYQIGRNIVFDYTKSCR